MASELPATALGPTVADGWPSAHAAPTTTHLRQTLEPTTPTRHRCKPPGPRRHPPLRAFRRTWYHGRLALALSTLLLQACRPPRPRGDDELVLALSPASCGCTLALDQRLTISHGTTSHGVDARLEIDAASVDVALLAAGQVVGTLRWDGERLEAHAPVAWPQMVTPARVLSELQLVWWPAEAVRNALPSSWTLVEGPLTRQLRQGGLDLVSVRYEGRPPGWQKVVLERPSRYTIEIESVEAP